MRRARTQVVTVCSRTSSSRPPEAICDASDDVATRAIVDARTEKVESIPGSSSYLIKLTIAPRKP